MKLLFDEPGAALAREAVAESEALVTAPIAYPEVRSALASARSDRRFDEDEFVKLRRLFEARWPNFSKVELNNAIVASAGEIAERQALRALDALHVASALRFAQGTADRVVFASWDRQQRAGAAAEGLALFPEDL